MLNISVIFTTYNSVKWLENVLLGYQSQNFKNFEVLIADDGSTSDTKELIADFSTRSSFPITHVWHSDDGFRKCVILNKAVSLSKADYLIFSDGDCVPRKDFLEAHLENRKPGCFLSGGAIRLPMELSAKISAEDILNQNAFNKDWLLQNGLRSSFFKNLKLSESVALANFMQLITTTKATWNGGNASAWKSDILAVNGFDERMKYGSEDREFGERLMNNGIKAKQIRYSAICLHLDHTRGYVNEEDLQKNAEIRATTKRDKATWTDYGIIKNDKVIL